MPEFLAPRLLRRRGKSAQQGHVSDVGADDFRWRGWSVATREGDHWAMTPAAGDGQGLWFAARTSLSAGLAAVL